MVFLSVHMRRLGCHVGSSAMKRNPALSEQSSVFAERARRVAVVGRAVSCVLRVHAAVRCFGHTVEFSQSLRDEVCPTLGWGPVSSQGYKKDGPAYQSSSNVHSTSERKDNF